MNNILVVKKVGNHWYPCIKHNWTGDIVIPRKIELIFNIIAMGEEVLHLEFEELHSIVEGLNIIWFNDADITQYMITDDEDEFDFDMHFTINDKEFYISSYLYTLLEDQFHFNFHDTIYILYIW